MTELRRLKPPDMSRSAHQCSMGKVSSPHKDFVRASVAAGATYRRVFAGVGNQETSDSSVSTHTAKQPAIANSQAQPRTLGNESCAIDPDWSGIGHRGLFDCQDSSTTP